MSITRLLLAFRRSKATDMCFHWLTDRVERSQFIIFWTRGTNNHSDYVTKHHPPVHNLEMRGKFFTTKHLANLAVARILKGCSKGSICG